MLLFILLIIRDFTSADVHGESEKLRQLGAQYLSSGNINEAIRVLQKSLEIDELNYMSQFLLATTYLTANDATSTKRNLNAILKYKSNFVAARILLAEVLIREAQFDNARDQLYEVLNLDENNEKALTKIEVIKNIEARYNEAAKYVHRKDYKPALRILDELVTQCDLCPAFFEMRAEIHMNNGNYDEALADLKRSAAHDSKNTDILLRISQLYFNLGEANDSIKWVRSCLIQDPDQQLCFSHYKTLKPIVASLNKVHVLITEGKWKECFDEIQTVLKNPKMSTALVRKCRQTACKCSLSANDASETVKICTQALETDSMNVDTLINRAEAYILLEKYDEALRDYKDAGKYEKSNRIDEGIMRIQRLKSSGKKRDYYKILGVPRTATKEQIGRAYRKLARKWHPDHYEGNDRAMAESKFKDIADAKEVLSDPEKRKEFDDGRDPLNPSEQSSHGFYPFSAQDFQPFGQGFTFRFHFG